MLPFPSTSAFSYKKKQKKWVKAPFCMQIKVVWPNQNEESNTKETFLEWGYQIAGTKANRAT
jgi:hypothetical protein